MSDLIKSKIRRLDFMLLLVLREGVRRRKFSDVAAALGVTQTAISHSVARLRDLLDDELFIRRPHGVEPTARAIELAAIAQTILEDADRILADPAPFDPASVDRVVRICALDFEVALLSGGIGDLYQAAPGLQLIFRGLGRDAAISALESDQADLWLGYADNLPASLESTLLFDEEYLVVARKAHPRITKGSTIDLATFCAEDHVVAAPGGTTGGIVDKTLAKLGKTRRVAVMTTGFLSVLDLVSRTDMIATVPARLARIQAANFGLTLHTPPVAPRPFRVSACWHRRASRDPAIAWLISQFRKTL